MCQIPRWLRHHWIRVLLQSRRGDIPYWSWWNIGWTLKTAISILNVLLVIGSVCLEIVVIICHNGSCCLVHGHSAFIVGSWAILYHIESENSHPRQAIQFWCLTLPFRTQNGWQLSNRGRVKKSLLIAMPRVPLAEPFQHHRHFCKANLQHLGHPNSPLPLRAAFTTSAMAPRHHCTRALAQSRWKGRLWQSFLVLVCIPKGRGI